MGQQLFDEVVVSANERRLLCNEHLTVDGTLLETAAGLKGFKPRDADPPPDDGDRGNPWVDLHGARRGNATHQSAADGAVPLLRKARGRRPSWCSWPTP